MIEGKLSNGFEYTLEDDVTNDYEILEVISEMNEDASKSVKLTKLLLGNDQYKALKEVCRVDGKVKMDMMFECLKEILEGAKETKN